MKKLLSMKKNTVEREDVVRKEERRETEKERERWVKEKLQLKIERKYPTMKMVFGVLLQLRISLFIVEEDSSLSKLHKTFKYFFSKGRRTYLKTS